MFPSVSTPLANSSRGPHCCIAAKERQSAAKTIKKSRRRSPLPLCRCVRCGLSSRQCERLLGQEASCGLLE
jgi:hypothetical protein